MLVYVLCALRITCVCVSTCIFYLHAPLHTAEEEGEEEEEEEEEEGEEEEEEDDEEEEEEEEEKEEEEEEQEQEMGQMEKYLPLYRVSEKKRWRKKNFSFLFFCTKT